MAIAGSTLAFQSYSFEYYVTQALCQDKSLVQATHLMTNTFAGGPPHLGNHPRRASN